MPRNKVRHPITDQEIAFARLILSGTMTDRRAAEAVGLNPDTAAYTKSKPRVRAYLLEHRAAVQKRFDEQDAGELRRFNLGRDQVLARLWAIANMDPERTRGSMSAQVKAISMIVAIEGLIPDRRAVLAQDKPAPPPADPPKIYVAEWLRAQKEAEKATSQPQPAQQEAAPEPPSAPGGADEPPPPVSGPTPDPTLPSPMDTSQTNSSPYRSESWVPDSRVPFSIDKNRFGRRR